MTDYAETSEPIEFKAWPKIARLNRDIIITEKIDGTNAAIGVTDEGFVYAQSRTRLITPEQDNFGFAAWVDYNARLLREELGPGLHFGEWWGRGIQRGYGVSERYFSPFVNPDPWKPWPLSLGVIPVPVLYEGPFRQGAIDAAIDKLETRGSVIKPGFMKPEGIVIYHKAAGTMFKVTLEGDAQPKGQAVA